MTGHANDLAAGAANLLTECGEFAAGEKILIVAEDPALGWYDAQAPAAVAAQARRMGLTPETAEAGAPGDGRDAALMRRIETEPNIVFFARIGDQDRFAPRDRGQKRIMCYARSAAMLASAFGTTSHKAMLRLKQAVNETLLKAEQIELACPLGTRVSGTVANDREADGDVSVRRFPMGVPLPLLAKRFSGRVALASYLTPTGNRTYEPACLALASTVFAELENGRTATYSGDRDTVAAVRAHYDRIASCFDIDRDAVHSWHAGIHPGMVYDQPVESDPDRWSNTAFCSPNYLHFHTCGAYAPGEICWMVAEPTITVDGKPLWDRGRLLPQQHTATAAAIATQPPLQRLFGLHADSL